jgi:hypothetical protein
MKLLSPIVLLSANANTLDDAGWENHNDPGWETHNDPDDAAALLGARGRFVDQSRAPAERRYADLSLMIQYLFKAEKNAGGQNIKFDPTKFWAYGCHCLYMNDRPMSTQGHGKPVDGLDRVCREYKECNKCAFEKHPTDNSGSGSLGNGQYGCIGEAVQYVWRKVGNKRHPSYPLIEPRTIHNNMCQLDLFLCDKQFAENIAEQIFAGEYTDEHSHYYSDFDADSQQYCPANQGAGTRECCGGWEANETPWKLFNAQSDMCTAGEVHEIGDI